MSGYGNTGSRLEQVVAAGKTFVAFDINEVGGEDEWNANVASRLLYRIANLVAHSQGKSYKD